MQGCPKQHMLLTAGREAAAAALAAARHQGTGRNRELQQELQHMFKQYQIRFYEIIEVVPRKLGTGQEAS